MRQEYPNGMNDFILSNALTSDKPLKEVFARMRQIAADTEEGIKRGLLVKTQKPEQPAAAPVVEEPAPEPAPAPAEPKPEQDTTQYLFKIKTLVVGRENALRVKELFTQIKAIAATFENID